MSRLISLVRRFWVDALILVGIGVSLGIAAKGPDPKGAEGPIWLDVLITLAFFCPLFFRRRFPMAAPLVSIVVVAASSFADAGFIDNNFAAFLAALGISAWFGMRPDLRQAIGGLVGASGRLGRDHVQRSEDEFQRRLRLVADHLLGRVDRRICLRPAAPHDGRDPAARRAGRAEREEQARLAVAEERARIARELHDVVGHSVSVMTVQASAVRRLLDPDQEKVLEALLVVEQTGRDALAEMRRMVGVLRRQDDAPLPS